MYAVRAVQEAAGGIGSTTRVAEVRISEQPAVELVWSKPRRRRCPGWPALYVLTALTLGSCRRPREPFALHVVEIVAVEEPLPGLSESKASSPKCGSTITVSLNGPCPVPFLIWKKCPCRCMGCATMLRLRSHAHPLALTHLQRLGVRCADRRWSVGRPFRRRTSSCRVRAVQEAAGGIGSTTRVAEVRISERLPSLACRPRRGGLPRRSPRAQEAAGGPPWPSGAAICHRPVVRFMSRSRSPIPSSRCPPRPDDGWPSRGHGADDQPAAEIVPPR